MFHRSSSTARFAIVLPLLALFIGACSRESRGPTSPSSVSGPSLSSSAAMSPSRLGAASSFTLLGGPAVTTTTSNVTGDVGAGLPGGIVTQTGGVINGLQHSGDAAAIAAYADFLLTFNAIGAVPCSTDPTHSLSGTLSGVTLSPGVYCFDSAAALTGVLTLNASGQRTPRWIFKVNGAITGTGFTVVMAGGAVPCDVTWWTNAAVTMTSSDFKGNVLAGAGMTFTGGTYAGQAMAKAAVTLTNVTAPGGCAKIIGPPPADSCLGRIDGHGSIAVGRRGKARFHISARVGISSATASLDFRQGEERGTRVVANGPVTITATGDSSRQIEGSARMNGRSGFTYKVVAVNQGPNGSNDRFSIMVWDASGAAVMHESGRLLAGDIRFRDCGPGGGGHGDDDDDDDDDDKDHGHDGGHGDDDGHDRGGHSGGDDHGAGHGRK